MHSPVDSPSTQKDDTAQGSRRGFLRAGFVGAGVELLIAGARQFTNRHEDPVAALESFALTTQRSDTVKLGYVSTICESSSLAEYELGLGIDIRSLVSRLATELREIRGDTPITAADLGGSYGTAIVQLSKAADIEPFCIDSFNHVDDRAPLQACRHIVRPIEDSGLPDESFDFLISHNSTQYFDMSRAIPEMYRLLKPGGSAFFDLWENAPEALPELLKFPHKDHVYVNVMHSNQMRTFLLSDFVKVNAVLSERASPAAISQIHYSVLMTKLPAEVTLPRPPSDSSEYSPLRLMQRMAAESSNP